MLALGGACDSGRESRYFFYFVIITGVNSDWNTHSLCGTLRREAWAERHWKSVVLGIVNITAGSSGQVPGRETEQIAQRHHRYWKAGGGTHLTGGTGVSVLTDTH